MIQRTITIVVLTAFVVTAFGYLRESMPTIKLLTSLTFDSREFTSLVFSHDGRMIAAGDSDGVVTIWDAESRERIATIQAHKGMVSAIAFSLDGTLLATGGVDKNIVLWQVKTTKQTLSRTYKNRVVAVLFHENEKVLVATGGRTGMVYDWNFRKSQEASLYSPTKRNVIYDLAAGNRQIAIATRKGIVVHSLNQARSRNLPHDENGAVTGVSFCSDQKKLLACSSEISEWSLADSKRSSTWGRTIWQELGDLQSAGVSPDGRYLAIGVTGGPDEDSHLIMWDRKTNSQIALNSCHRHGLTKVVFSPRNQNVLVSCGLDGKLNFWQIRITSEKEANK